MSEMDQPKQYSDNDRVENIRAAAQLVADEGFHEEADDLREHAEHLHWLSAERRRLETDLVELRKVARQAHRQMAIALRAVLSEAPDQSP